MKSDFLPTFRRLHTWTGLATGILLFIAFYAGSLTMWSDAVADWQRGGSAPLKAETLARVPAFAEAVTAKDPAAKRGFMVTLPGGFNSRLLAQWQSAPGEHAAATMGESGDVTFADPASRELSKWIDQVHRTAGIPGHAGEIIMGLAAFFYGLALISGVIIYLPVLSKDIFALRLGKNLKRWWQDVHVAIGMLSLPFHLIFALTAAVMLLHDPMFILLNKLVYGDRGQELLMEGVYNPPPPQASGKEAPMTDLNAVIGEIETQIEGFEASALVLFQPGDENAMVTVYGHVPNRLAHTTRATFSGTTGELLYLDSHATRPHGITTLASMQALHFGDYGGFSVRWGYFILGLGGAFLFYSGNLLWLAARKRKNQLPPRSHRFLAALTAGVCLGSCLATAACFVAARWLNPFSGETAPVALATIYWGVLAVCLIWAFIRPATQATKELLWGAAVLCALIPISQFFPGAVSWAGRQFTVIDAGALAFAALFVFLARVELAPSVAGHPEPAAA